MAEKSLSQRLADSKGQPIEYEGRTLHGIYRADVHPGDVLFVRFLRSNPQVREGLSVSVKKGFLLANGRSSRDLIMWKDTVPEVAEIECRPPKTGAMLHAWNAWEQDGMLQAWLGNAGMLVEQQNDAVILKCSDGVGPPDFQDLVVELRLVHRHKNP